MHLEKKVTGGYLVLDPGDHDLLAVSPLVDEIPLSSPELPGILNFVETQIADLEHIVAYCRETKNATMFQVHGEKIALEGIRDQINRYRSMTGHASMTPAFDHELWGSLHDEPVGQRPMLEIVPDPGFDPGPLGPTIA